MRRSSFRPRRTRRRTARSLVRSRETSSCRCERPSPDSRQRNGLNEDRPRGGRDERRKDSGAIDQRADRQEERRERDDPVAQAAHHLRRRGAAALATANTAEAASPPTDPAAAAAAKLVPCSSARNSETGPDVNGRPTSHPLIEGPNRRPTIVATAMSAGVRTNLSARITVECPH